MDAFLEGLGISDAQILSTLRERFQRLDEELENTKAELRSSQLSLEHVLAQQEDGQLGEAEGASGGVVAADLQRRLNTVLAERSQLSSEVDFYRNSFAALQTAQGTVREQLQSLRSERDEAILQRSQAEQEAGRLREETERLISQNAKLGTEKVEKHQKICALEAELLEEKLACARFEKMQTDYKEQVAWLDEQLTAAQDSQRKVKQQMGLEIASLQDQLARETEDKKLLGRELESVHTANKRLTEKLGEETEALCREREEKIAIKHSFQRETENLQQLNQALEKQLESANTLIESLENENTELKESLRKTRQRLKAQVTAAREAAAAAAESTNSDDSFVQLSVEGESSFGSHLEQLSSETFKSLTEKTGEVFSLKKERDELTHRLQKRENEQKSLYATFMQVKRRYEELVPKHQHLTARFETLAAGKKELEIKNVELERLLRIQRRENGDLAKQVQTKLFTTERQKARADESLMEFADVRELHENYRTVVARLRLLEENQDPAERAQKDQELKDALQEIQNLWKTLNGSKEKMQLLVRQRDQLRTLLHQSSGVWGGPRAGGESRAVASSGADNDDDDDEAASELQDNGGNRSFADVGETGARENKLRKQHETLKQEFQKFKEEQARTVTELMSQVDQMRERAAASALDAARKETAAEFAEQRRAALEESASVQSKLVTDLQGKIAQLNAHTTKYQQSITQSQNEKQDLLQTQRRLEKQLETAKIELATVNQRATALEKQNASLQEESQRLQKFLDTVQQTLTENVLGAEQRNAHRDSELEALRGRLASEAERLKGLQREIDRLRKELDGSHTLQEAERATHASQLEELRLQNAQLLERSTILQSLADTETQRAQSLAVQLAASGGGGSSDFSLQLNAARENESFLRTALATAEEAQSELQRRLSVTEATLLECTAETQSLRSTIAELEASIARLHAESGNHSSNRRKEEERVRSLEEQIGELKIQLEQATARESALKQDMARQRELAKQASLNYDREVVLHSEKIQQLSTLKEENERLAQEAVSLRSQLASIEDDLQSINARTAREKAALEKSLQESREHAEHFSKHNEALHGQIESLTERLRVSQFVRSQGGEGDEATAAHDYQQEIVKHLRREKSVIEAKLASAQQETLRMRLHLEQMKRQLSETQKRLEETLQNSNAVQQTNAEHVQLMSDIQQLNLLRESNITLRNEAAKYLADSKEWQKRYEEYRAAQEPLQAEKQELQRLLAVHKKEAELNRAAARKSEEKLQEHIQDIGREQSSEAKRLAEENKQIKEDLKRLGDEQDKATAKNAELTEEIGKLITAKTQAESRLIKAVSMHKQAKADLETMTANRAQLVIDLDEVRAQQKASTPVAAAAVSSPIATAASVPSAPPAPATTTGQATTPTTQPTTPAVPSNKASATRVRPPKPAPVSSPDAKPAALATSQEPTAPTSPTAGKPTARRSSTPPAGPALVLASAPSTPTPTPTPAPTSTPAPAPSAAPTQEPEQAKEPEPQTEPQPKPEQSAAERLRKLLQARKSAEGKRARDEAEEDEGEKRQRSQTDSSSDTTSFEGPPAPAPAPEPSPAKEPAVNDDLSETEVPAKRGGRGSKGGRGGQKRGRS